MTKERRDLSVIRKIIQYCDGIADSMTRFGRDIEILKSDNDYQDSVAMKILQIGELSGHLSAEFKQSHPEIPWRAIKDMRNVAAHEYEEFNQSKVWDTMTEDIPELREYCQRILDRDAGE